MAADDALSEFHVPGTKFAYFLGCFERRVTIYSQQVRALNLAAALISGGIIGEGARIAVIGGGVAGVTLAAAVALGCQDLREVVLFEKKPELLHLQRPGRDRYIHPHLYDWPDDSLENRAGLPILDWTAGSAADVADQILCGFEEIRQQTPKVVVRTSRTVTKVTSMPLSGCEVKIEGTEYEGGVFDIVVFAVGFGYERLVGESVHSYWAPSQLQTTILTPAASNTFFVSGNGDGGLVDFAMAVLGESHQKIVKRVSEFHGLDNVKQELRNIESEAWRSGEDFDLLDQYQRRLVLPPAMPLRLYELFRPNDRFVLHTKAAHLFRKDTSVLNRFVVFALAQADQAKSRIQLIWGKQFDGDVPTVGPVRLVGEDTIESCYRFLRLGPDQRAVMAPFKELADEFVSTRPEREFRYRPATPKLHPTVELLFGALRQTTEFRQPTVTQRPGALNEQTVSSRVEAEVQKELVARAIYQVNAGSTQARPIDPPDVATQAPALISWSYALKSGYNELTYVAGRNFSTVSPLQTVPVNQRNGALPAATLAVGPLDTTRRDENELHACNPVESDLDPEARVDYLKKMIRRAKETLEMERAFALSKELENTLISHEASLSSNCRRSGYTLLVEIEISRGGGATSDALDRAKEFLSKAQNV